MFTYLIKMFYVGIAKPKDLDLFLIDNLVGIFKRKFWTRIMLSKNTMV